MGFNIAGLVINQNYEKDIKKLGDDLKWGIEVIEEVNFETASSNWTPEGEFRLHFTDKATMIFFPHEWVADQSKSKTVDTLNYAYSATSMAFQVDLFKSGKLIRSIMEYNGEKKFEVGEPIKLEKEHETADSLTFALIDELLGDEFGKIDLGEKSFRCKKTQFIETDQKEIEKQKVKAALEKSPALRQLLKDEMAEKQTLQKDRIQNKPVTIKKKWWEFWK